MLGGIYGGLQQILVGSVTSLWTLMSLCWMVSRLVVWSVYHNFLKNTLIPCSYRNTFSIGSCPQNNIPSIKVNIFWTSYICFLKSLFKLSHEERRVFVAFKNPFKFATTTANFSFQETSIIFKNVTKGGRGGGGMEGSPRSLLFFW